MAPSVICQVGEVESCCGHTGDFYAMSYYFFFSDFLKSFETLLTSRFSWLEWKILCVFEQEPLPEFG